MHSPLQFIAFPAYTCILSLYMTLMMTCPGQKFSFPSPCLSSLYLHTKSLYDLPRSVSLLMTCPGQNSTPHFIVFPAPISTLIRFMTCLSQWAFQWPAQVQWVPSPIHCLSSLYPYSKPSYDLPRSISLLMTCPGQMNSPLQFIAFPAFTSTLSPCMTCLGQWAF